jgi:hypothetical protein
MAASPTSEESAGRDAAHRPAEPIVERAVGAPPSARLPGRAGGRAQMWVTAQVAVADAPALVRSVPAGASMALSFVLLHAPGSGTPGSSRTGSTGPLVEAAAPRGGTAAT